MRDDNHEFSQFLSGTIAYWQDVVHTAQKYERLQDAKRHSQIRNDVDDEFSQFLSGVNTYYSQDLIPTVQKYMGHLRGYDAVWTSVEATLDEMTERLSVGDVKNGNQILATIVNIKEEFSKLRLNRDRALTSAGRLLAYKKMPIAINVRDTAPDLSQPGQVRDDPVPPSGAFFLLDLCLTKTDRQVLPGDMQQEFTARLAEYGPRLARLWFWAETARVIARRNPVCRWILVAGITAVGNWIKHMMGG